MEPADPALTPPSALRAVALSLRARVGDGPSTGAVVRIALTLVGLAVLLWVLWQSRSVLQWLAISAFFAVAMNPLVGIIQRRLRLRRSLAIAVVYLLGSIVVALAALVFVPPLIDAARGLVDAIPGYIDRVQTSRLIQDLDKQYNLLDQVRQQATKVISGLAGPTVAVDAASRVVNGLVALVSIAVITFLLSLYGPELRDWAEEQFEGRARVRATGMMDGAYKVIAGYVVGVCIVALIGSLAASTFMLIARVPYVPVLGLWVALMTFIPMVGATLGAVPYVTVAFFQGWPVGVAAVVFLVIYQQIENNLVQPFIHRRTVQLNPLWIIIAVLLGTQLLGLIGALVAIPVAGIIQVMFQTWARVRRDGEATTPPEVPATDDPGPLAEAPG